MRFSKLLVAISATSMIAAPVAASAASVVKPVSTLSIAKNVPVSARVASKAGKSKAAGSGIIILVLAGAAVAAGVVAATSGDSSPDSP